MESRDQVMALCGFSLLTNHFKLSDISAGKLSMKSQFITHNSNKAMASEVTFTGSGNKKQTCHPPRKYRVQGEKCIGQAVHSGKTVSLILCVWKLGYVKSGHILLEQLYECMHASKPIRFFYISSLFL